MSDPFDPGAGKAGKREGMDRAERPRRSGGGSGFMLICALEVAKRKPFFSTDDLEKWRLVYFPNHTTHEHRASRRDHARSRQARILREDARLGGGFGAENQPSAANASGVV